MDNRQEPNSSLEAAIKPRVLSKDSKSSKGCDSRSRDISFIFPTQALIHSDEQVVLVDHICLYVILNKLGYSVETVILPSSSDDLLSGRETELAKPVLEIMQPLTTILGAIGIVVDSNTMPPSFFPITSVRGAIPVSHRPETIWLVI